MKIINKIPEICFTKGNEIFVREDFFENICNELRLEDFGLFMTVVGACNKENYIEFKDLMTHCKKNSEEEIFKYLGILKTKNLIEIEE